MAENGESGAAVPNGTPTPAKRNTGNRIVELEGETVRRVLDIDENTGTEAEEMAENHDKSGSGKNLPPAPSKRNTGNRIVVPEGETVETMIRKGMEMEADRDDGSDPPCSRARDICPARFTLGG